nr:hypothetical protein [Tanacetum cinerariifolium]
MDIRDEIKLSKEDMLSDSDENKHRNKLPGVKAIDRVSSIKSKLKDTGKSNSPKSRWVSMSERVLSPQPVTQYSHITGEVRKESEKAAVVKKNSVVSKSKAAAVVSEKSTVVNESVVKSIEKSTVVNESVVKSIEKSTVVKDRDVTSKVGKSNFSALVSEKSVVDDNPKVSKVSDESNKATVVAPVIDNVLVATETDKETEPVVVADVKAPVVVDVETVVEKDNPKVTSKVSDESVKAPIIKESVKVPVVKKSVKASSVVTDKPSSENQDKIDVVVKKSVKSSSVVADKPSSVVADKVDVVVKKSVKASSVVADKPSSVVADKVDVVKDKVDVVADKASDALKNKLTRKGKKPVVGKDKDKPKNIAPDVVKEKFKPNPKQKVISSKSPVLRLLKQEENQEVKAKVNVKRKMILSKEYDRKKLKGKSKKDVSDFELETDVVDYSSNEANRKRKKLKIKAGLKRKMSGYLLILRRLIQKVKKEESDEDSIPKKGDKIEVTPSKIHDMLGVPFGGYSLFDLDEREADHEFADGLKGQICLDVVRRLSEDSVISDIDWCGYIYDCLRDSKLPGGTNHYLGPLTFLILLYLDFTKFDKFSVVRTCPAIRNWSSYLIKQSQKLELKNHVVGLLDLHDEWNEAEVQESEGFISFSETSEKEDLIKKAEEKLSLICAERVILEDYMRKASLKCPDDGNGDNVGDDDDDENGDDDGGNVDNDANDCDGNGDEEDVNEGDKDPNGSNPSFGFSKISLEDFGNDSGPAEKDKAVEGKSTEQGTGDLFGDNSATLKAMNQEITPEKLPTQKGSPSPKKRAVKPSSYLLSPYMNKKTNVVPKITRLKFILGSSLFAMQGDNMVIQSKSREIHSESHMIYSESHVIHFETHVIHFESHVIHFESHLNLETLTPGLWLDANVIDCWGTVLNHEQSFRANESKSKHFFPTGCISKSMFNGTLASFDAKWESFSNQVNAQFKGNKDGLALEGIDLSEHFYVVVFSLTKTTAMTILDNSPGTYDSKYKEVCDLLVAKVKHTIPKLKWKIKENFHDCGIFTMLHMKTFDGGPASNLDCGLPVEKMLELAKEFDKTDHVEKMAIIVDAFKKREKL